MCFKDLAECDCTCHTMPDVHHIMPCCYICPLCDKNIANGMMTWHREKLHTVLGYYHEDQGGWPWFRTLKDQQLEVPLSVLEEGGPYKRFWGHGEKDVLYRATVGPVLPGRLKSIFGTVLKLEPA